MILYHEADPKKADSILEDGLKRTSRGEKGDDSAIIRTDKFLDDLRPDNLIKAGVSRDDNLYMYLSHKDKIVDIETGEAVELTEFMNQAEGAVLKVEADARRCFVSDLDIYDKIKKAIENKDYAEATAKKYWSTLVPLDNYKPGQIKRPEVMITYDIPPEAIEIVNQS